MQNSLQSISWKLLASFSIALVNCIGRYLTNKIEAPLPSTVVLFTQSMLGAMLILPFIQHEKYSLKNIKNLPMNIARVIFTALGLIFMYVSLKIMSVIDVLVLNGLSGALFAIFCATTFLKERLTLFKSLALLISFIAGYFVANSSDFINVIKQNGILAIMPIISSCSLAMVKIFTRKLAKDGQSAESMTVFYMLFILPVLFIPAATNFIMPSLNHIPWLLLLGILTFIGCFATNKALESAEVIFLLPLRFSKYFLAATVAYLWFGEYPQSTNMQLAIISVILSVALLALDKPGRPITKGSSYSV